MQPTVQDLDDAALAVRAQHGDPRAFSALLRRHHAALLRVAMRRTRHRADAEDVVQEAAVKAWQRLATLREPGLVRAWMAQIVAREALRVVVARREGQELDEHSAVAVGPDQHVDRFDLHRGVRAALLSLPASTAHAWILREADGLSYREIGQRLHAPESAVRGRLVTARKRVQRAIDECCPAARPLPVDGASAVLGVAAPTVPPVKAPVATSSPVRSGEVQATAALRSSLHQDLDLGLGKDAARLLASPE